MADQKLGLPVRTEADVDERVQVKIVDGTTVSQVATVDADGNVHIAAYGNRADDDANVALKLSELGYANGDGVYEVDDNSDPSNAGLIAHTRAATPTDAEQVIRTTGITNNDVHALDTALHNSDGSAIDGTNPLPVQLTPLAGTRVHDYNTASAIASDATDNHDFAVVGTDLKVYKVLCSASSRASYEIQSSTDGIVFNTVAKVFTTTAEPTFDVSFQDIPLVIPAGGTIRVIRENRDNQSQDLYSTIVGVQ